jgi:hypothetical protein
MADNTDNGAGVPVATRSVTYSGDAAQNAQVVGLVAFAGSDDAKTATDLPGDATNGLDVDITRLPAAAVQSGTWNSGTSADTALTIDTTGLSSALVLVTRSGTVSGGVLSFEWSPDGGTTWFFLKLVQSSGDNAGTYAATQSLSGTNSTVWGGPVGGATQFRVRLSTVISGVGSITVLVTGGAGAPTGMPVYVANSSTVPINVTPTQSAVGLLEVTASGRQAKDAPQSANNPVVLGGIGYATGAAPSANSGNGRIAPLLTDLYGHLKTTVVDANGVNSVVVEGVAALSDPGGMQLLARRRDSLSTETTTDGHNTALNSTGKGELYVKHVDSVPVTNTGTFATQVDGAALTALQLIDDPVKTDDAGFTAATDKVGMMGALAVAIGADPDAADANDAAAPITNRHRVQFVIGGHPNVLTLKHTTITTAVTDAAIITVGSGNKICVTRLTATLDNASTVFPTVLIGFGATNTPTTTGVLAAHGGVPAGGGFTIGDGSGVIGQGADGDDLRVTTTGNATGNGLQICVSYFLLPS